MAQNSLSRTENCTWFGSVRGSTLIEDPPWPGTIVTICMSCFRTGGPGKEHRTNKPPPTRRVRERSKGDTMCPTTSQNPSLWHPSLLNKRAPPARTLSQCDWLKTTRKLIPSPWNRDCEPHGRAAPLGSLTLLLSARAPFPDKIFCFVSTCVSSDNSFLSVRREPSFWPWKGSPFL